MRNMYFILLIFTCLLCPCITIAEEKITGKFVTDPDVFRNTSEMIADKGYLVEEHSVTTLDGYVLPLQRIPSGRKKKESRKDIVLLIHGIGGSSTDWVMNFPEQSLGYILADEGYDVWLGNTRGNKYTKHVKYSRYQPEFWDFSFDEMANYDVPAMIDYILDVTGKDKLSCVGYSQGGAIMFALLSDRPEYNRKVKLYVALASSIGCVKSPITFIAPFSTMAYKIVGNREIFPSGILKDSTLMKTSSTFLNKSRIEVYGAHNPAGTSVKSYIHFGQIISSKKFAKFDYVEDNLLHYNQEKPLEYNLSLITAPVAIIYAPKDIYANSEDVSIYKKRLKSLVTIYEVPSLAFKHLDFVIGLNTKKLVYDHMLMLFTQY